MSKCKVARKKKRCFFLIRVYFFHISWFCFQGDFCSLSINGIDSPLHHGHRHVGKISAELVFFWGYWKPCKLCKLPPLEVSGYFRVFVVSRSFFGAAIIYVKKNWRWKGIFPRDLCFFFFFRSWWVFMLHVKISNYSEQFCASRNAWGIVTKSTHGYSKRYPPGN